MQGGENGQQSVSLGRVGGNILSKHGDHIELMTIVLQDRHTERCRVGGDGGGGVFGS